MKHLFLDSSRNHLSAEPLLMRLSLWLSLSIFMLAGRLAAQNGPVAISVDATESTRKLLHARLTFPAQPGRLTLLYPKWIPGEHGPNGPITDLVDLKMSAGGKTVDWHRDDEDMFAFNLEVPAGANAVEVALDFLLPPSAGEYSSGASASAQLVDLNWNLVLLYPKGAKAAEIQYQPSLHLPQGWKFGTALPIARQTGDTIEFSPASLETLVDSPVIAGAHFRTLELTPGAKPEHFLHLASESDAALEIKPEDAGRFARLVAETGALFGARHYRSYHFLLTLSEHVAHFGLEHHESSDDREGERYLIDEDALKLGGFLLPHEMTHSWNGKYRRPAGLVTPDFQQPMKGDLLWVYEGLTDYLGIILATRCGIWTNAYFRDYLALEAARLDHEGGRAWRPLADTTAAAQLLYLARSEGEARRRSTDFYEEGDLIWLEADVLIRQQTQGHRSLDDFCKKFHGGENGPPVVRAYTLDDVVATLNEIAPYDWRQFFQKRVYAINPRAPLGGIEGSGWRLGYTNVPQERLKALETARKYTDLTFSIGLKLKEDGGVTDVMPASAVEKAGVGTAMKLVAVNGRRWTPEILRTAVNSAKTNSEPIELLFENEEYFKTYKVDYHEGDKYPMLERDASKPDLLSEILRSQTPVNVPAPK